MPDNKFFINYAFSKDSIPPHWIESIRNLGKSLYSEFLVEFEETEVRSKNNDVSYFSLCAPAIKFYLSANEKIQFYELTVSIDSSLLPEGVSGSGLLSKITSELQKNISVYTFKELLELIQNNIDYSPNFLRLLSSLTYSYPELNEEIAVLYIKALGSANTEIRSDAGWKIYLHEGYYEYLLPFMEDQLLKETDEGVIDLLTSAIEEIKSSIEEEKEWNAPKGLDRIVYDIENRKSLTNEEKESLERAIAFLNIPYDLEIWYSERCPKMGINEAEKCLNDFERWQTEIEQSFSSNEVYNYEPSSSSPDVIHPLGAYIISSQFLWHYYRSERAEKHLLRSLELAKSVRTKKNPDSLVLPKLSIAELYHRIPLIHLYENPIAVNINLFYLGEIYEHQKDYNNAIDYYVKFTEAESFSPRNSFALTSSSYDYFDTNRFYPGTVEALKRIANIYLEHQNDTASAKRYFEKAVTMRPSHHTPFREQAQLVRLEGNHELALHYEEKWLQTMLSYPDPTSSPCANCLPFNPEELVAHFSDYIAKAALPKEAMIEKLQPLLSFLERMINEDPFGNAYSYVYDRKEIEALSTRIIEMYGDVTLKKDTLDGKKIVRIEVK